MTTSRIGTVLALGASAVLVAGCGSAKPTVATSASATGSTSSSSTPSATPRTAADLKAALLDSTDLTGFTVTPGDDSVGPTLPDSATQACKDLAGIVFAAITPGSLEHAKADFKRGTAAEGSEELDAMGTPEAAAKLADDFKTAASGCPTLSAGGHTLKVKVGPGQNGGAHDVSYSVIEGTQAVYGEVSIVGDVFVESDITKGGDASDAAQLNKLAVEKVKARLTLG